MDKFDKALKIISEMLDELNKLPKLKYVELIGEMNDLLWCLDGIDECNERMETENDDESIMYYTKKINERNLEIKTKWLWMLN